MSLTTPLANAQPTELVWNADTPPALLTDTRRRLWGPGNNGISSQGQQCLAWAAWIAPQPCPDYIQDPAGTGFAGIYACTLEPMNKTPVTQTMVASLAASNNLQACKTSQPGAPGTRIVPGSQVEANGGGGPSLASNFRSDHSGGGNFLMADGSVHFITEDINMLTYQQLSTMAGGEIAEIPQ